MAYDYFSDTPFDLNHDGKIDSNEAAYIYENFFNEDNEKHESYEDVFINLGNEESKNTSVCKTNYSYDVDEIMRAAEKEDFHKTMFIIGVMMVLAFALPSSPMVSLLVGGILLILKCSKGF